MGFKSYIIYRCYECNVKRIFNNSEQLNELSSYVEFDKIHHNHNGYIMIEKINDGCDVNGVILKIANEWSEYAVEINNKLNKNGVYDE